MKTTCIMCPIGCKLNIQKIDGKIIVKGNACVRGEIYGKSELENPTRIVTSLVKLPNGLASVKTTNPVPKDKIFEILNIIKNLPIKTYKIGEIVAHNVLNLNSNIVVTGINIT